MRLPSWRYHRPTWLRRKLPVNITPGNEGIPGIYLKKNHVPRPSPEPPQGPHFRPLRIDHSVWTLIDVYLRWLCGFLWLISLITTIVLSATQKKTSPYAYFALGFVFINNLVAYWAWWFKRVEVKCLGIFDLVVTGTLIGAIFGMFWVLGCDERKIDLLSCRLDPLTLTVFVEMICLTTIYVALMLCAYLGFQVRYRKKKQAYREWKRTHARRHSHVMDEEQAIHEEDQDKQRRRWTRWFSKMRLYIGN
ncbi:hypothetical protein VTO42DRAFT_8379 [Malbranchea cinnamomea]